MYVIAAIKSIQTIMTITSNAVIIAIMAIKANLVITATIAITTNIEKLIDVAAIMYNGRPYRHKSHYCYVGLYNHHVL